MTDAEIAPFLSGALLYGDDFTAEQIRQWFADEAGENESYQALVRRRGNYRYGYERLNRRYLYRHLGDAPIAEVLGFGSAAGDELLPIITRVRRITIIEPGRDFWRDHIAGVPAEYHLPEPSGDLPCADASIDLITCLGVLHHIPNVSHVIAEFARVLRPGGRVLLREPIVSMGDWRRKRGSLTRHERGIPLPLFRRMIAAAGLEVVREHVFGFGPLRVAWSRLFKRSYYESATGLWLDHLLASMFRWNYRYHAVGLLAKFRPNVVAYVLRKPPR